jgi:hypothetical protein
VETKLNFNIQKNTIKITIKTHWKRIRKSKAIDENKKKQTTKEKIL